MEFDTHAGVYDFHHPQRHSFFFTDRARPLYCRLISTFLASLELKAFDVKALRAFRVLRPLKLVSGVPSKYCGERAATSCRKHDFRRSQ